MTQKNQEKKFITNTLPNIKHFQNMLLPHIKIKENQV